MAFSPVEVLKRVPLFSGLSEADIQSFADLARERSYPKGSVIVFEDDPGDAMYLVAAGQVKVVLIAEDGREVILSVLGEGSFFGEMSVIDEEPRSAHVIAMEDSNLLVLRREDFQETQHADGVSPAPVTPRPRVHPSVRRNAVSLRSSARSAERLEGPFEAATARSARGRAPQGNNHSVSLRSAARSAARGKGRRRSSRISRRTCRPP